MKRFVSFLVLTAILLSACGTVDDVSSVLENSSIEETSSEEISSEDVSSEETSSNTPPLEIAEDEPYALTLLTDEEIKKLTLPEEYYSAEFKDGVFAKEIIAISFTKGSIKSTEPLYIRTSLDGGESWSETIINDRSCNENFITFSSEKNGYIAIQGEHGLAHTGDCSVFVTHDGGKNWQEATSTTTVSRWCISDALFISRNIGFVCHTDNARSYPVFCKTVDGGVSWEQVVLYTNDIESGKALYTNIDSAEFKDDEIIFNVTFFADSGEYVKRFVSKDFGESFVEE